MAFISCIVPLTLFLLVCISIEAYSSNRLNLCNIQIVWPSSDTISAIQRYSNKKIMNCRDWYQSYGHTTWKYKIHNEKTTYRCNESCFNQFQLNFLWSSTSFTFNQSMKCEKYWLRFPQKSRSTWYFPFISHFNRIESKQHRFNCMRLGNRMIWSY